MSLETERSRHPRARGELRSDLLRYLPSQGVPALIGLFTIPILTRLFDPAAYGDYRLILATVGIFGSAGSWMAGSIYRFYPEVEREQRLESFTATLVRLFGLTAALFAALWVIGLVAARPFVDEDFVVLLVIGLFLMLVNSVWSVSTALLRAVREVSVYSTTTVLNKVLTLAGGIGLVVLLGLGVDGLLFGSIAGSAVLLPITWKAVRKHLPGRTGSWDGRLARSMLRYGLPLTLMQVANWALQLSDRYIIAGLRGTGEVGLYTAAYGIAEQGMRTILLMFQLPFAILGSRVWERDGSEAAADFVSASARSYLLLAVPAWAGLSILAKPLMTIMTDGPYREASVIMPVVSAGLLTGGIMWWYTSGSTFMKKTEQQAIAVFSGVVANVVLNLTFVGRFGYQAAAVTTFASYLVGMAVMVMLSRREFKWAFPFASLWRSLGAAGMMAGAIAAFNQVTNLGAGWTVVASMVLGVAVYGAVLWVLREPEARRLGRRVINRLTRS